MFEDCPSTFLSTLTSQNFSTVIRSDTMSVALKSILYLINIFLVRSRETVVYVCLRRCILHNTSAIVATTAIFISHKATN